LSLEKQWPLPRDVLKVGKIVAIPQLGGSIIAMNALQHSNHRPYRLLANDSLVETLDIPALGVVGEHPHHNKREIVHGLPGGFSHPQGNTRNMMVPLASNTQADSRSEHCLARVRSRAGSAQLCWIGQNLRKT
jgi:hypothetical protein